MLCALEKVEPASSLSGPNQNENEPELHILVYRPKELSPAFFKSHSHQKRDFLIGLH
jgi:hypothetical protein